MRTLLFDLDGTLTDPFVGITKSVQYALEKLDAPVPPAEDLRHVIGPPLNETYGQLLGSSDASLIQKAIDLYRERYTDVGLFENVRYDGILEVLEAARARGERLFVCTSKPWVYAEKIIEHFGLSEFFEKTYGCELDMTRSNKVDLLAYLLEQEQLDPAQTVMIGDRKHDILAGLKNATQTIGVLWGYGSREELETHGAHCVVESREGLTDQLVTAS